MALIKDCQIQHDDNVSVTLVEKEISESVSVASINVHFDTPTTPTPISFRWEIPCRDAYSVWSMWDTRFTQIKPSWNKHVVSSRLAAGAPLEALISMSGNNRYTIALSDAATPADISITAVETNGCIECLVKMFTQQVNPLSDYSVEFRVDATDKPYYEVLRDVDAWWDRDCGYPTAYIPDAARMPMYSAWYSYHQDIVPERIIEQCKVAKAMGMESIIIDDGWQTDDTGLGYAYCGDWEPTPTKIPDMKKFVDDIHATGMKVIFWYSVPYVGMYSKAIKRFSTMLLGDPEKAPKARWACLDPRFPEVREYLVNIYKNAILDWGFDGFKLDFIDSFQLAPGTPVYDERRDTQSLEDGVDKLLAEVTSTLRAINPEVLIEFRQNYIGPVIRKYGNMFRVTDCPLDPCLNRTAGINLRYILGKSAVHSDMLMWHPTEPVEAAARHLLSCFFTVPQISVKTELMPDSHNEMLANYLGVWRANRELILDGELKAYNPESHYSLVTSEKDGELIAVSYTLGLVNIDKNYNKMILINATGRSDITVVSEEDISGKNYIIYDCIGDIVEKGSIDSSLFVLPVPDSGRVEIM